MKTNKTAFPDPFGKAMALLQCQLLFVQLGQAADRMEAILASDLGPECNPNRVQCRNPIETPAPLLRGGERDRDK